MAKKINYPELYTLRADGRYQKRMPDGKYLYDRDPEILYQKEQEYLKPKEITFAEVAETWEKQYREMIEESTWMTLKKHYRDIVDEFGEREIKNIDGSDVYTDLQKLASKGYSRSAVNARRSIWNNIMNYALAEGIIRNQPASLTKMPKNLPKGKRRSTTTVEDKLICQNIDAPLGFFAFFVLCTGLRRSEALALLVSDIDWERSCIHITKSQTKISTARPTTKAPKTASGIRDVPIMRALEKPLKDYLKGHKSIYLFPAINFKADPPQFRNDLMMNNNNYCYAWKRYCQTIDRWDYENNKPLLTLHSFRHGTATMMFEDGVDEFTAQRILGHSSISTTREIYTELRAEQLAKSTKKFGKSLNKLMSK